MAHHANTSRLPPWRRLCLVSLWCGCRLCDTGSHRWHGHCHYKVWLVVVAVLLYLPIGISDALCHCNRDRYFEEYAGLSSFGYAAVDQVMLPFTLMPVVYLANRYPTVALWLGDQPGPGTHTHSSLAVVVVL